MKLAIGEKLIRAERRRQVRVEHWTATHDDGHRTGALAEAAACYERHGDWQVEFGNRFLQPQQIYDATPRGWPWGLDWFKLGHSPLRTFIKAGALFVAEIDRLQRRLKRAGVDEGMRSAIVDQLAARKRDVDRVAQKIATQFT